MAKVARERSIPLGSPLYEQGLEQFRGNMQRILQRFATAGVPVYVGTLASNERDQAPFLSLASPAAAQTLGSLFERGRSAARGRRSRYGGAAFREALKLDDGAADGWFGLGQTLAKHGRYGEARAAFLAAKDRDALRFRAPEAINDVLRELAADGDARLVDTQRALVAASRDRIIGSDLMLEHLHPERPGLLPAG